MRRAQVFNHGRLTGVLEEIPEGYCFTYDSRYLLENGTEPVSLTLPIRRKPFVSEELFPFFNGLLAEGATKDIQCRSLKLDENDHFGRLIKTAQHDVIGSVTVVEIVAS